MSYVDMKDLDSHRYPIEQKLPPNLAELNECSQYEAEVEVLRHLTAGGCSSAPKYLADFRLDKDNPWVKNGFLCFVVMSRVPGRPMSKVWPEAPRSPPNNDVLRIWSAFKAALL